MQFNFFKYRSQKQAQQFAVQNCQGYKRDKEAKIKTHINEVDSTSAAAISFSRWLSKTAKKLCFLLAQELIFDANPPFPLSFLSGISDWLCVNILSVALGLAYSFMVLSTHFVYFCVLCCKHNTSEPASTVSEIQNSP